MEMATLLVLVGGLRMGHFDCSIPEHIPPPPNGDVRRLHPGHISLVMAMGDSITAAFAAKGGVLEYRELSWAIGTGSSSQMTVPWLMGQYTKAAGTNHTISGMSTKAVVPNDILHMPHDDYHPKTDFLNVAESEGAVHRGSMDEQWAYLLPALKTYPEYQARWKHLTVWMTANDVCGKCSAPLEGTKFLEQWEAKYNELLMNVTSNMRNVYVSFIGTFALSAVARVQRANTECTIEHKYLIDECGCIDRGNSTELDVLDHNVDAMNTALNEMARKWRSKLAAEGRNDVTVVYHEGATRIGPQMQRRHLSALDCFHPSAEAHQSLAVMLWDSLVCDGPRNSSSLCGATLKIDDPEVLCPLASTTLFVPSD